MKVVVAWRFSERWKVLCLLDNYLETEETLLDVKKEEEEDEFFVTF